MSGYDTGLGGRQDPPAGLANVPAFDGTLTTRSSAAPRARDPFDPTSVVVDPQIPQAARQELERRGGPDYGVLASAELVRFMDPPPVAPAPPRSLAAARQLAAAAWALFAVSIAAGVLRGPDTFAVLFVIGALRPAGRVGPGGGQAGAPGVRGRADPARARPRPQRVLRRPRREDLPPALRPPADRPRPGGPRPPGSGPSTPPTGSTARSRCGTRRSTPSGWRPTSPSCCGRSSRGWR